MESRRMLVFQDMIKAFWNDDTEIAMKKIPDDLVAKGVFNFDEKGIITDYMRICMGLNPIGRYDVEFSKDIDVALKLKQVEQPLIAVVGEVCKKCGEKQGECKVRCEHEASEHEKGKGVVIKDGKCLTCGKCIPECPLEAIADKIEFVPLVKALREKTIPVYAAVAPAYIAQFGDKLKMGQIRNAFKAVGFTDMVEVALFADILTLKEVHEFEEHITKKGDYMITSCCCPVWVNMIKNGYPELLSHFSPVVSPMVAAGRVLKMLYPGCIVAFVGPCVAKKNEAKSKDVAGSVDYVLTFVEMEQVFKALNINIEDMPDDPKHQSSFGGRVYARTGGVSKAVEITLKRVAHKGIRFKAIQGNGVKECKALLDRLKSGEVKANFIEGMGCAGGCVGGPRAISKVDDAIKAVNKYAKASIYETPADNARIPIVMSKIGLSERIGIENEELANLLNRELYEWK